MSQLVDRAPVRESVLRDRNFRRVWMGATVSSAGDAASWIALVALTLGTVHANLAVLAAVYTAPVAAGGLLSGWALDRFDRRRVLIADSVIRAAALASIPIAAATGHMTAGQLYGVAGVYGFLKMVSLAGFPAMIPSLVTEGSLTQANALEGASYGLASLSGALLAGLAIPTIGPLPLVAADAVTYALFALAVASVGAAAKAPVASDPSVEPRRRHSLWPILRAVWRHRWLRELTVMFALFNIGEGALLVFLPHRAIDLGLGAGGYGWLVAATTGGELVAAAALVRMQWRFPLPASVVAAQLTAGALILLLLIGAPLAAVAALALFGVCTAPMTAWAQTLRMQVIPADARGRTFALLRTLMQATPPLGALLAALVLAHGTVVTVLAIGATMVLPALLLGNRIVGD